jgi:hypothetical protein
MSRQLTEVVRNEALARSPSVLSDTMRLGVWHADVGAMLGRLRDGFVGRLTSRETDAARAVGLLQRLCGISEINDLLRMVEASGRVDQMSALGEALGVSFRFNGLDNLEAVANRPVVLYANHPMGGGNVLGMSVLLESRFPDYRMLGNRHFAFTQSFAEKLIPVDPFARTATTNIESLVRIREEFGKHYQALSVFPSGISSRMQLSGAISDRTWKDAFVRIARHHDALLVPVWFSDRNRLRYYVAARICRELGFLALPQEFLHLRGKTITVTVGKPISPDTLRAIPCRRAQTDFLRAAVYEMGRQANGAAGGQHRAAPPFTRAAPIGKDLEVRVLEHASAMRIGSIAATAATDIGEATYHVILTRRGHCAPIAHWQVLDWSQFTSGELNKFSPLLKSFRLPGGIARASRHWLEITSFGTRLDANPCAIMRHLPTALHQAAGLAVGATDIVALIRPPETNAALAGLQFARLQKSFGDASLQRAGARTALFGATYQHDWRPQRDVVAFDPRRRADSRSIDPLLRHLVRVGFKFGAAGLTEEPLRRPCILGRLNLAATED